jgi:hypothetical protein
MTRLAPDDPKRPLRCPSGCGNAVNFILLVKCARCARVQCDVCIRRFKKRPYCKSCIKELQRAAARSLGKPQES